MRWVVEVSSMGKTDLQQFVLEAESWQRALQAARAQRGEQGPMSGFSIELLEEGYRAVDPLARVRFVVKRAPDDLPLSSSKDAPSAPVPPKPASVPRVGDAPRPEAKPAAVGSPLAGLPPTKLLSSREQDPTEASPLTYCEYSFAVPSGTSEASAVEVLRGQLALVQAQLGGAKAGKLVNLAAFDVEFTGKPPSPPLATLAWKDWKGEPVVAYPRRAAAERPQPAGAPQASLPPTFPAASLPPANPGGPTPPVAPAPAPASASPPAPASASPPAPAPAPAPPPAVTAPSAPPPAPITQKLPSQPPPPANGSVPPPGRSPSHPPSEGLVRSPSGRFVRGRTSGDELITSLFESMHDLHFLRDALDGGQFCLALATEVLPSRGALIHFFDVEKREWVIACTRGKDTTRLLTLRTPESDEQLREAARLRRSLVVSTPMTSTAQRYQALGSIKSLIVAPIMQVGRALGALEIINPLDGQPFTDDEGNAMTYIAEQYAEYLGSRGIVLDRDRIQRAAATR
jgi:hypothetical protein